MRRGEWTTNENLGDSSFGLRVEGASVFLASSQAERSEVKKPWTRLTGLNHITWRDHLASKSHPSTHRLSITPFSCMQLRCLKTKRFGTKSLAMNESIILQSSHLFCVTFVVVVGKYIFKISIISQSTWVAHTYPYPNETIRLFIFWTVPPFLP